MKIGKYDIKLKTLKYKKVKLIDDRFGVYCVSGKQGSNKTYYSTFLATEQNPNLVNYVKTNIHSLNIPNLKILYFTKLFEIYHDTDERCIYIIDEISRKFKKNSPCDDQFYAWLNQSRKRGRIVILITQEWLELPMWLRRPVKYNLTSTRIPILSELFGLYCCSVGSGYDMKFNKDEGEYECPTIRKIIYKRNRYIANMYDTLEPINDL